MIASDALRQRRAPIDRSADRRVALLAIVVAVAFLVAALASLTLPQTTRLGAWLPIHLALAGGATTAIAGVMPFFVAAFAAAPPSDARLRGLAVTAVALGTAAISVGVPADGAGLAAVGGAVFLAGIALTGMATLRPLRGALGPSRGPVIQGYVLALAEVGVGASIATLFLAGWPPVVDGWASLKPAHAWLNLVGFVSLVIATTLLHFFPTVIGARIAVHPSARLTVVGLAAGAPLVAAGFVTGWDWLARVGALGVLGGTVSLAVYVGRAWQRRARWTTDHDWHRFAMGGLISSVIWLELGTAVAAGRVLVLGAAPAAWRVNVVIGPLIVGWVGLAIVASATHLLPAVGPGDQATHARQRVRLGRWANVRLAAFDGGVLAMTVGLLAGSTPLAWLGLVGIGLSLLATAGLLLSAAAMGFRQGWG
jgi:hypothetical protein